MQTETEIALANLDWLIHHDGMRLEYGARAVLNADGEPAYVLDDLAAVGLTPATEQMVGRLPLAICTEAVTSRKLHFHRTESTTDHSDGVL
jgi:hypothetical protein